MSPHLKICLLSSQSLDFSREENSEHLRENSKNNPQIWVALLLEVLHFQFYY